MPQPKSKSRRFSEEVANRHAVFKLLGDRRDFDLSWCIDFTIQCIQRVFRFMVSNGLSRVNVTANIINVTPCETGPF